MSSPRGAPMISGQKIYLQLMECLGYDIAGYTGVCHGFVSMWVQAVLCGQKEVFISRHQRILREIKKANGNVKGYFQELKNALEVIKNKVKLKEPLQKEEQEKLDILAFFDGIALHQGSYHYTALFGKFLLQSPDVFDYTASKKLMEKDNSVVTVFSEPRIYNKDELIEFLHLLQQHFSYEGDKFCLVLSSRLHIIGIEYDKKKWSWNVIDINLDDLYLDESLYHRGFGAFELADLLMVALYPKSTEKGREYLAFNIDIYSTSKFKSEYQDEIDKRVNFVKTQYPLDEMQCLRVDEAGSGSLLHLAAKNRQPEIIDQLVKGGADLNCTVAGMTPAHVAAIFGHEEIVASLADKGADICKPTENTLLHYSPIIFAIHMKHWRAAAMLLLKIETEDKLGFFEKNIIKYLDKDEVASAFIEMLHENNLCNKQAALDVINGKNALGQILNEFRVPFSYFFNGPMYEGKRVTKNIDRIIKALDEIQSAEVNSSKKLI